MQSVYRPSVTRTRTRSVCPYILCVALAVLCAGRLPAATPDLPEIRRLLERPHPVLSQKAGGQGGGDAGDALLQRSPWGAVLEPASTSHDYLCDACSNALETQDGRTHVCVKCGAKHTGEKMRRAYLAWARKKDGDWLQELGAHFHKTGFTPYADKAIAVFLQYAGLYTKLPKGGEGGHLSSNWLQDAFIVDPMIKGFDYVYDACPPEARAKIADGLFRPAARAVDRWFPNDTYPEGNLEVARCIGPIGLVIRDPDLIYRAFYNPAKALGALFTQFEPDGLSSKFPAYHVIMVQQLDWFGKLLGDEGTFYTERMAFLNKAVDDTRFPDGSIPGFGHGSTGTHKKGVWDLPSANFESSGLTFLRNRGPAGLACFGFSWGMPKRNDGERLDLQFYAAGEHLVRPSGIVPYGNHLFGYFTHALSGNTMLMDGHRHERVAGKLTYCSLSGEVRIACARNDGFNAGASMQRHILLLPDGVGVALDFISCAGTHNFDWVVHGAGELKLPMETQPGAVLGESGGYKYLSEVRAAQTSTDFVAEFAGRKSSLRTHVLTPGARDIYAAMGPYGYTAVPAPLLLLRAKGVAQAVFATVFEPAGPNVAPAVRKAALEPGAGAHGATLLLSCPSGEYSIAANFKDGSARVTRNGAALAAKDERGAKPPAPPAPTGVGPSVTLGRPSPVQTTAKTSAATAPDAAPNSAPVLAGNVHREALVQALQEAGVVEHKKACLFILGQKQTLPLAAAGAQGLQVVIQGNQLALPWKDLSNEDLIAVALACCYERPGALVDAGALAASARLTGILERITTRLYELDPQQAQRLESLIKGGG